VGFGECRVSALLACAVTILFSHLFGGIQHSRSPRGARSSNRRSWASLVLVEVENVEQLDEFEKFT